VKRPRPFYAALRDIPVVEERAVPAADIARRWAARHRVIQERRLRPLSLLLSAAGPTCSARAIASQMCATLWVFALDDLFDDPASPEEELHCIEMEAKNALHDGGGGDHAEHAMTAALREVRSDLVGYPLFGALEGKWSEVVARTIAGMRAERVWQVARRGGSASLPSYADYLESGGYSIGAHAHAWTAIVTLDDSSAPRHVDWLHELIVPTAWAIRLVNDLRSHEKELAEGGVNAVILHTAACVQAGVPPELAEVRARERVGVDIDAALAKADGLAAAPRTDTGLAEAALVATAHLARAFYAGHDFHTFVEPGGAPTSSSP